MHAIYELKEMLCEELENYGKKGELSAGTLDIVDKLAHTVKNLDKIIESYEETEYSGGRMPMNRGEGYNNRGMSYARGRNARRDSRGRYSSEGYSRNDDIVYRLREVMNEAPDEQTRMEIQNLVSRMESM